MIPTVWHAGKNVFAQSTWPLKNLDERHPRYHRIGIIVIEALCFRQRTEPCRYRTIPVNVGNQSVGMTTPLVHHERASIILKEGEEKPSEIPFPLIPGDQVTLVPRF